jgi:hypothetical protein
MSLQLPPHNLPSKKARGRSHPAIDAPIDLEKPYRRQLWDYAFEQTRGQTVGLVAGAIGSIIAAVLVGIMWGGVWAGIATAAVAFLATLGLIFIIYYAAAPKALDQLKAREIARLLAEREERERNEVIPVVSIEPVEQGWRVVFQSGVELDIDVPDPSLEWCGVPKPSASYLFKAHFRVRCENPAPYQRAVRSVRFSLMRVTGRGEPKPIPMVTERTEVEEEGNRSRVELVDFTVAAGAFTPWYWFTSHFQLRQRYATRLNEKCFVRLTMEAVNQDAKVLDFGVNWDEVMSKAFAPLTPKTPA